METLSKIINGDKYVLVDFYASWCAPCKLMEPELKTFAQNNKTVRVLKINIDKNTQSANQFNIQGVPTLILFKQGKVIWRRSGAMSSKQIELAIKPKL